MLPITFDEATRVLLDGKYLGVEPPPEPAEVRRLIVRVTPHKVVTFAA